jgi:hypothetical protein
MVSPIRTAKFRSARTLGAIALVGACAIAEIALAADQPTVPFEHLSKISLNEKSRLHYDDYAGKISDSRIKRLLRSGPILGDRVLLRNDVSVYFPDGHIVSSQTEFHSFKPKGDLRPWDVYYRRQIEPNPRYARVAEFDQVLGPVCAETQYLKARGHESGESFTRMRISKSGVMTFEIDTPGRYDYLTGEITRSYTLTSAINPYYLGDLVVAQSLIDACHSGSGALEAAEAGG